MGLVCKEHIIILSSRHHKTERGLTENRVLFHPHTKQKEPVLFLDRWISVEAPQLRAVIVATAPVSALCGV